MTDLDKLTCIYHESRIYSSKPVILYQQKQIDDLTPQVEIVKEYIKGIGQQLSQIAAPGEEPPPPYY